MAVIKHLDLDKESLNIGTKNKQRLMERTISYVAKWHEGTYDAWIKRLSIRLNISTRTVRENYLDPLISEGIIKRIGSELAFVGLQNEKGADPDT